MPDTTPLARNVDARWMDCRSVSTAIETEILRKQGTRSPSWKFLIEVLRNPKSLGAIAPTSRRLAQTIVDKADVPSASKIIELGAGGGAVTEQIVKSKRPAARVLAIERNPAFVSLLDERFSDIRVICDCVTHLSRHARAAGFEGTDSIVSALPWTIFPFAMQRDVLAAAAELLAPHGIFATFACLGLHVTAPGRRFRALLEQTFREVRASPIVWRNVPPAFVYRCTR